jgi:hypothetical protein
LLRLGRLGFRWTRISLLFAFLVLLALFIHLTQIGFPGFFKTRLLTQLRARGVDLEYQRLRLHWYRGIIAEQVSLGPPRGLHRPRLEADEVRIRLDAKALARFEFAVDALNLENGRLILPLGDADRPPLRMEQIMSELRFLPGDRWELNRFHARWLGVSLNLSGTLNHASALGAWKWGGGPAKGEPASPLAPAAWQTYLHRCQEAFQEAAFARPPELRGSIHGDARTPLGVGGRLSLVARDGRLPWAAFQQCEFTLQVSPSGTNHPAFQSSIECALQNLHGEFGRMAKLRLGLRHQLEPGEPLPLPVEWELEGDTVETPWVQAPQARLTGRTRFFDRAASVIESDARLSVPESSGPGWQVTAAFANFTVRQSLAHWLPERIAWDGTADGVQAGPVQMAGLHSSGDCRPREPAADLATAQSQGARSWREIVERYAADIGLDAEVIHTPWTAQSRARSTWQWEAPRLTLTQLTAQGSPASVVTSGTADLDTRWVEVDLAGEFNWALWREQFKPQMPDWMNRVDWAAPIETRISLAGTWPDMTAEQAPFWKRLLNSLSAQGSVAARQGSVRGVFVDRFQTEWSWSGTQLDLTNALVEAVAGSWHGDGHWNVAAKTFQAAGSGRLQPAALKPWLSRAEDTLSLFQFNEPLDLNLALAGQGEGAELGYRLDGQVQARAFVFRDEPFDELTAALAVTPDWLVAREVVLRRAAAEVRVPALGFEFGSSLLHLTNAQTTIEPMAIIRAIGPKTARALAPYHFTQPPQATVHGWINVADSDQSDLRIDLAGGPFQWWLLRLPQLTGSVFYVNNTVTVSNLQAEFYRGRLEGELFADLNAARGADLRFAADVTDADLHGLMSDLKSPTNRFEGSLRARLEVSSMNSDDWNSWQGGGHVEMQDGLLWDEPMVGLFSPLLNGIVPGLGSSRAKSAQATYRIRDSIIITDDLEIRAPPVRLQYKGDVDFAGRVRATVMAEVFRDASFPGKLFNLALWPITKAFEYRVTGTLGEPKSQPLYIPRFLLFPLQPFRTLRSLFPPPAEATP